MNQKIVVVWGLLLSTIYAYGMEKEYLTSKNVAKHSSKAIEAIGADKNWIYWLSDGTVSFVDKKCEREMFYDSDHSFTAMKVAPKGILMLGWQCGIEKVIIPSDGKPFYDKRLYFNNTNSGEIIRTVDANDNVIVGGSTSGKLTLWNTKYNEQYAALLPTVIKKVLLGKNKIFCATQDGIVWLYTMSYKNDAQHFGQLDNWKKFTFMQSGFIDMAYDADNKQLYVCDAKNSIVKYMLGKKKSASYLGKIDKHPGTIKTMFVHHGALCIAGSAGKITALCTNSDIAMMGRDIDRPIAHMVPTKEGFAVVCDDNKSPQLLHSKSSPDTFWQALVSYQRTLQDRA